jgi:hypothetical protein
MRSEPFDPTAGERARAIHEHREDTDRVTDPTAGERARQIRKHGEVSSITDPTDPRAGQLRAPRHPAAHGREASRQRDPNGGAAVG